MWIIKPLLKSFHIQNRVETERAMLEFSFNTQDFLFARCDVKTLLYHTEMHPKLNLIQ